MRISRFVVFFLFSLSCLSTFSPRLGLAANRENAEVSEEMLQNMARDEQNRRIQELTRMVSNLERKVVRLGDRIEQLDYDLKELRRKVKP